MEKIELTKDQLKNILHAATGNVRDFVMNEDRFIKEWLDEQLILHPVSKRYKVCYYTKINGKVMGDEVSYINATSAKHAEEIVEDNSEALSFVTWVSVC
tara:strand:- start:7916 stop:8212 length:297 start_codon:yes stop_codon:yes gene_type:complete